MPSVTRVAALTVALALVNVTSPDAQTPGFDVASIKRNQSGAGTSTFAVRPGGRFVAMNVSLRELMLLAYGVLAFQLEAAPSWAESERFDVNAKAEGELPPLTPSLSTADTPLTLLMIQSLLADRFRLTLRSETRDMARYALVLAHPGRLGPQLKASPLDCAAMRAERARAARAAGTTLVPPPPPPPPPRGQRPPCTAGSSAGYHSGSGVELSSLVSSLSRVLGRSLVDETGLTGPFEWTVEYAPYTQPLMRADGTVTALSDKPSLPAALEEQLGLKLEARRGPVRMLIVEHVERPTPD